MQIGLIIPQLFYDCIARIIPGMAILSTVFIIWGHDFFMMLFSPFHTGKFMYVVVLLMTAYIIAFVLEGVVKLMKIIRKRPYIENIFNQDASKEAEKKIWKEVISNMETNHGKPFYMKINSGKIVHKHLAYDYIRLVNPEAGSRIVKLKAELTMCENLVYGWILVFVAYLSFLVYLWFCTGGWPRPFCGQTLTLFTLSGLIFFVNIRRLLQKELYLYSIYNHWLLIKGKTF